MGDVPELALALVAGAALGVFFFVGLWLTVRKGVSAEHPALWFVGSMMLRTLIIVAGFTFVSQNHWSRLVMCLLGFLIARIFIVRRLTRATAEEQDPMDPETSIAPQSR